MKFPTEAGYDVAINALKDLGLPTLDKNPSAIHLSSESSAIYPSYQHGLPPPQPANLLPSPNFTNRPYTSSSSEHRQLSLAPGVRSERPYTAPQPVSFSQTLPPRLILPPQMQLLASNMAATSKAPESLSLGAVGPEQSSAKPAARKRALAKTAKPKAVKNVAPSKVQETRIEAESLLNPSAAEARKKQAQAKEAETLDPVTTLDSLVQPPGFHPAANDVEAPPLASPRRTGPIQPSVEDGLDTTAAAAKSHANDVVQSKSITDTSTGSVPVLLPVRQAMAEVSGNSPGLDANHPVSTSTAQPAIPKSVTFPSEEEVSAEEFMSGLDTFIRDYQHLPAPEPRPTAADDLAAYAAQPDEVRQAVIKDMIFDFLRDENFIKLAEDMSKEWRRIGLGL